MDKKFRETTNLFVEIMNSKRQVNGETWSRGTNSRLPFDVNVMLNISIKAQICSQIQRVKKKTARKSQTQIV